ncbi:MAG: glycoside hydrolase family 20 zincin-like fold domain-containing protein [Planctomycetota bacterium]
MKFKAFRMKRRWCWTFGMALVFACGVPGARGEDAGAKAHHVADRINLVPTPQEIALLPGRFPVSGWSIVAASDNALIQSGAREVNDRIGKLGGQTLPVVSKPASGNFILVARCDHRLALPYRENANISVDNPGEQGYVIRSIEANGRTVILALGSDDLGVLYACMTLRQLIQPGEEPADSPVLLDARVRDWPAFKRRCFGCLEILDRSPARIEDPEKRRQAYAEEYGPYLRYLARNKINYTNARGLWGGLDDAKLPAYREASAFARRYGIRLRMISGTALNDYLKPGEWTDCVVRREAKHCWSAHEAHRQKARDVAELARQLDLGCQVLHVVDMGGLLDPERWSQRCDRCRAEYGDDHARAVIEQMRLYYTALQEIHAGCLFEAVVQPYHFQWTVPGYAEDPVEYAQYMPGIYHFRKMSRQQGIAEIVKQRAEYHRRIAQGLPSDILVTFREGGRAEFDGVCELWQGHPVDIWYYLGRNHGWKGLWKPQCRYLKTWYRDEPRDLLYTSGMRPYHSFQLHEVDVAANAEYAWSLNQPDAEPDFHISKRLYRVSGHRVTPYQRQSLIPRIARRLWGHSAAPLGYLVRHNVSLPYIAQPGDVAGLSGERFDDPYQHFEQQANYLSEAREQLDALWADMDAGKASGVYGDLSQEYGYRCFLFLDYVVTLGAGKGEIEVAALQARRLADEGRFDEALEEIDEALSRLPVLLADVKHARERFASEPVARRFLSHADAAGAGEVLAKYDFAAQPDRFRKLQERIRRQADAGTIPAHLKPLLANRRFLVAPVRSKGAVRIDGRAREKDWANARAIEFFTTRQGRQLARFDTRARLLWDKEAIYVHADMLEAEGVRPPPRYNLEGGHLPPEDHFEVVLSQSKDPTKSWRFSVTPAGRRSLTPVDGEADDQRDWKAETRVQPGKWTAELRIPFVTVDAGSGKSDGWRVNLIRHRVSKLNSPGQERSSAVPDGESAPLKNHAPMIFVDHPVETETETTVRLVDRKRRDETVEHGFATRLWITPEIQTNRAPRNVTVTVSVRQDERLLAKKSLSIRLIKALWRPPRPVEFDLGQEYTGDLAVTVAAHGNNDSFQATKQFVVDEP